MSKGAGEAVAKIPIASKGPVDEAPASVGGKLGRATARKTEKTMEQLAESAAKCSAPFVENIGAANKIYNRPTEILVDAKNVHFLVD